MTWWQAIILGLVEGLTEYLPVSSTGHLILAQRAMGLHGEAADAYAICIQAGAIVAVLGLYWRRVRQAAVGWAGKVGLGAGDADGFRLGLNLLLAFLPAAVFGLLLDAKIEELLFHPWPVAVALFVGGLAIIGVDRWRKRTATRKDDAVTHGAEEVPPDLGRPLEGLTPLMALGIGMIQCIAMWPGTSRSLVTIVGGVLVGLSLASAVEFSFLLGVVTLLAATLYKSVLDSVEVDLTGDGVPERVMMLTWMAREYGWLALGLGTLTAWASAVLAVRWMVAYLKRHGLSVFGYYRVGLAAVVAVLIVKGLLGE